MFLYQISKADFGIIFTVGKDKMKEGLSYYLLQNKSLN